MSWYHAALGSRLWQVAVLLHSWPLHFLPWSPHSLLGPGNSSAVWSRDALGITKQWILSDTIWGKIKVGSEWFPPINLWRPSKYFYNFRSVKLYCRLIHPSRLLVLEILRLACHWPCRAMKAPYSGAPRVIPDWTVSCSAVSMILNYPLCRAGAADTILHPAAHCAIIVDSHTWWWLRKFAQHLHITPPPRSSRPDC